MKTSDTITPRIQRGEILDTSLLEETWVEEHKDGSHVQRRGFREKECPPMTRQADRDECDINVIVKRYDATGQLPAFREGMYADVSTMPDYRTALDTVSKANDMFMALPAEVRNYFHNDPATFLDTVSNPANREKLIELGLFPPDPTPPAKPAETPAPPVTKEDKKPS